jgi:hypothetical protein
MNLRKKKTPRASQHYMGWRAEQKSLLLPVAGEFFLLTLPFIERGYRTLSLLRERKRLGHLQHGMMVLFVGELMRNPPSLTRIELYCDQIRSNDAKAARLATASSYLGFTLCE